MYSCQHLKFQLLQIPFSSGFAMLNCIDSLSALAEQRVNMCCAFTHQLYSIRWAHWTWKVGLPLAIKLKYPYKTPHLRYRIVLQMFSVAFYLGFTGIEQPKKVLHGWRDVKKIPDRGKKTRYHKRDKSSSLSRESKSATYHKMQSAHMRTQVMQRHRPKSFFFLFLLLSTQLEKNNKYSLGGILSSQECKWTGAFHTVLLQCPEEQALSMTSSEFDTFGTTEVWMDLVSGLHWLCNSYKVTR